MKFGVYLGPIFPGEMEGREAVEFCRRLARTARESGFDGVFAAHHYLTGPSHLMLHPLLLLAGLAREVEGLHLGTAVFLLPFTHPIEVAEAAALLDVLCGGRLILGVGQGYRDIEFRSFGVPRALRGRRLAEGVRALRALWAEEEASFEGEFFRFRGVTIRPKPVQRPGPPIWVGADTVESVARVPEVGDAWVASGRHSRTFLRRALEGYKARLEALGRPFTGVPMFREMHIAPDSRRAEARMREALEAMYRTYARWGQPGERYDRDFAELKRERLIVGDPRECAEEVRRYQEEFQVPFLFFRVYWPGMDPEWALETVHLFGQEVIPLFR